MALGRVSSAKTFIFVRRLLSVCSLCFFFLKARRNVVSGKVSFCFFVFFFGGEGEFCCVLLARRVSFLSDESAILYSTICCKRYRLF